MKSMKKKKIKFVYFDIGGVLMEWRPVLTEISRKHNKPLQLVRERFGIHDTITCRGEISYNEMWKRVLTDLQVEFEADVNYLDFCMKIFKPIRPTHEFATHLSHSLPIGLLTNIHEGVFQKIVAYNHIPKLKYKAIVQSCEIGYVKPDIEIYLYAQKKAKVPAESILFIDDREENIRAAAKLGWVGFMFDTDNPDKSIKEIRKLTEE